MVFHWMNKLDKFMKRLTEITVFILFATMVVLVFAQVYTRFLTNNSLTWSEELSRFIMIWMVFLASTLAYREGSHIVVDKFVASLPPKIRPIIEVIAYLFVLIFVGVVLWGAFAVLPATSMQKSPANRIVMSNVYVAIPICMILIAIETIKQLVSVLSGGGGKAA